MKTKTTNKCQICGVRYKMPSYLKLDKRERMCMTCEINIEAIGIVLNRKSKQSKISIAEYFQNIFKELINE